MPDTLGLLEEAMQIARDLGYRVREEPLGDSPGGACVLGGRKHLLVNAGLPAAQRLGIVLGALAGDPGIGRQPMSRLLERALGDLAPPGGG